MAIQHVGITVSDWDRATHFYSNVLGLPKIRSFVISAGEMLAMYGINSKSRVDVYRVGNDAIEIISCEKRNIIRNKQRTDQYGICHFGMRVRERKRFSDSLKDKGVEVITLMREGREKVYVKDPDGNIIELRV